MLPDPFFADAICDRLVHNAHLFVRTGGSMRNRKGLELNPPTPHEARNSGGLSHVARLPRHRVVAALRCARVVWNVARVRVERVPESSGICRHAE